MNGGAWKSSVGGERVERRLAAVMAADVVGYSRLMGADEVGTLEGRGASQPFLVVAIACHVCLGDIETAKSLVKELLARYPSERVSDTAKRFRGRPEDVAKIEEAHRLSGMPE